MLSSICEPEVAVSHGVLVDISRDIPCVRHQAECLVIVDAQHIVNAHILEKSVSKSLL